MKSIASFSQDWRISVRTKNFVFCNCPIPLGFGDFVPVTITFCLGLAVIIGFRWGYPEIHVLEAGCGAPGFS
jgi:hypothetical protein